MVDALRLSTLQRVLAQSVGRLSINLDSAVDLDGGTFSA
jgi:hypothetical protein